MLAHLQFVQFDQALHNVEYRILGDLLADHPGVTLRVFGHDPDLAGLEFLRWFPRLRRFRIDHLETVDLDQLQRLPEDLQFLGVGETRRRALDLTPAIRFQHLRELRIVGHKRGLAEIIDANRELEAIALSRLPVDKVLAEIALSRLDSLTLKLGSLTDIGWLNNAANVRYLALRQVRGITDVDVLASFKSLVWLWLDSLGKITKLPDLSGCAALLRVELTALKTLRNVTALNGLARAPQLREVLVSESHLPVAAFKSLAKHPTLERIGVGLGSLRRNDQASALLARPPQRSPEEFAAEHRILHLQ
jgi:hypothetical protein